MEEMVKGAVSEPDPGAYIAEKKSFFGWTRRSKTGISRRKSTGKQALDKSQSLLKGSSTIGISKTSIGPEQQARIQAAAQRLYARQMQEPTESLDSPSRRGRNDTDTMHEKTNSVFTLQPIIVSEASPAMKWANKYDKDAIREAYLSNSNAGRGLAQTTMRTNGHAESSNGYDGRPQVPAKEPSYSPQPPAAMPSPVLEEEEQPKMSEKAVEVPPDIHPRRAVDADRTHHPSTAPTKGRTPECRAGAREHGLASVGHQPREQEAAEEAPQGSQGEGEAAGGRCRRK